MPWCLVIKRQNFFWNVFEQLSFQAEENGNNNNNDFRGGENGGGSGGSSRQASPREDEDNGNGGVLKEEPGQACLTQAPASHAAHDAHDTHAAHAQLPCILAPWPPNPTDPSCEPGVPPSLPPGDNQPHPLTAEVGGAPKVRYDRFPRSSPSYTSSLLAARSRRSRRQTR